MRVGSGGVEGSGWGGERGFGKSREGTSSYDDPGDTGLSLA
jgi:hypothetical protein